MYKNGKEEKIIENEDKKFEDNKIKELLDNL